MMNKNITNEVINDKVQYSDEYETYENIERSSTDKQSEVISYSKRVIYNSKNENFQFTIDIKKQILQEKINDINS